MCKYGKERFDWELENFIVTRLRPAPESFDIYNHMESTDSSKNMNGRLQSMMNFWEKNASKNRTNRRRHIPYPQLTNHNICHEMFWNAFHDRSKMYLQIQDIRTKTFIGKSDKSEDDSVILQCSLLTLQMLDYDIMMFNAMNDPEDPEYRDAAQTYYHPYFFSYIVELNQEKYNELQRLQKNLWEGDLVNESSRYLWLECTFNPYIKDSCVELDGYVAQSASRINKIGAKLYLIENGKNPRKIVKSILDAYTLNTASLKDDNDFIRLIDGELSHTYLSTIDAYKIGNGNCIFAQNADKSRGFFYDIGFHYRHRPKKRIGSGTQYTYSNSMKEIYAQMPSLFILSHWDMDHIAGSVAATKGFLDKDWFAPDCYDACTDAKRLAKYLDLKGHLILAKRPSKDKLLSSRLIGKIDVKDPAKPSRVRATYRLYMGENAACDNSSPNCEGIVIEYRDILNEKTVLMMGDVNYTSFNMARSNNHNPSFADTRIDYLIAPHHGSEHTDYHQITNYGHTVKTGIMAIICCTNNKGHEKNRPYARHLDKLRERFGYNVYTTEQPPAKGNYIRISL